MNLLTRITPAYKSATRRMPTLLQRAAPSGLTALLGSLLGRSTPIYKTVAGHIAQTPGSPGFLSMFAATPSYKTAPRVPAAETELVESDVVVAQLELGIDDRAVLDEVLPRRVVVAPGIAVHFLLDRVLLVQDRKPLPEEAQVDDVVEAPALVDAARDLQHRIVAFADAGVFQ